MSLGGGLRLRVSTASCALGARIIITLLPLYSCMVKVTFTYLHIRQGHCCHEKSGLIRVAYENPYLRNKLLPIIQAHTKVDDAISSASASKEALRVYLFLNFLITLRAVYSLSQHFVMSSLAEKTS